MPSATGSNIADFEMVDIVEMRVFGVMLTLRICQWSYGFPSIALRTEITMAMHATLESAEAISKAHTENILVVVALDLSSSGKRFGSSKTKAPRTHT